VGHAVRAFLESEIGVPPEKIRVIHGFPIPREKATGSPEQAAAIRSRLGIPADAAVVGMSGFPSWRKGVDLFVQLASQVNRSLKTRPCHFIWLGGQPKWHKEGLYDAEKLGIAHLVHFIPSVGDPYPYYALFDIFALTSREEPFSVSMLEAAECGLPIVCFADAGGAPELVGDDAGIIVPYLDIDAMARACIRLLEDNELRHRLGDTARQKVQTQYSLARQGPKLLEAIKSVMSDY
jgi:glycosyltransferase involved in cell wall biosynthesis